MEDISSNEIQFSFLDLVAPEPGPTRILLSTLINFIEFTTNAISVSVERLPHYFNGIILKLKDKDGINIIFDAFLIS